MLPLCSAERLPPHAHPQDRYAHLQVQKIQVWFTIYFSNLNSVFGIKKTKLSIFLIRNVINY